MSELTLAYREEQLEMYRAELREALRTIEALRTELAMALDRAERAEETLRTLREEIREARRTPFDA